MSYKIVQKILSFARHYPSYQDPSKYLSLSGCYTLKPRAFVYTIWEIERTFNNNRAQLGILTAIFKDNEDVKNGSVMGDNPKHVKIELL